MAIKIDATGKEKKTKPTAKSGAKAQAVKADPLQEFISEVGEDTFDRMLELQHEIEKLKPQMDELEKLRTTVSNKAMTMLDKSEKWWIQREQGLIEVPACSKTTVLVDKDLAIERLKEINPALVDECFTPAIGKLSSYLSGPMAEGVFDTEHGKSRKPKVKYGK